MPLVINSLEVDTHAHIHMTQGRRKWYDLNGNGCTGF